MRTLFAASLTLLLASTTMASSSHAQPILRFRNVVGVITALGVDNPVCGTDAQGNCVGTTIHSGTFAWVARDGNARVNLSTGAASFQVDGLVINGTQFSGTPGPVTQVEGTLVCNLGGGGGPEAILDTAPVSLSSQGDAEFSGQIAGIPATCDNPRFLIRIVTPAGALGAWIATGTEPSTGRVMGLQNEGE